MPPDCTGSQAAPLKQIPTNIITGFLGAGKTTAIRHLLAHKPPQQRWALLINEFGEVGIDAALLNQNGETNNIFVREVPGGCLCCTNQLNLQIALNLLLSRARPQRLLIEPTGLGHPRELLELLSGEYSREVLSLHATLTLVDARHITDKRYHDHAVFNQQLQAADIILANKADLYSAKDLPQLHSFLDKNGLSQPVIPLTRGAMEPGLLDRPSRAVAVPTHTQRHNTPSMDYEEGLPPMPEQGYLRIDHQGEGYFSNGWIFEPNHVFDYRKLMALLNQTPAIRLKGVFITNRGILRFNRIDGETTSDFIDETADSRVERITRRQGDEQQMEQWLTHCLLP